MVLLVFRLYQFQCRDFVSLGAMGWRAYPRLVIRGFVHCLHLYIGLKLSYYFHLHNFIFSRPLPIFKLHFKTKVWVANILLISSTCISDYVHWTWALIDPDSKIGLTYVTNRGQFMSRCIGVFDRILTIGLMPVFHLIKYTCMSVYRTPHEIHI